MYLGMCGVHTIERVLRIRINIRDRAEGGAARNRFPGLWVDKGKEVRRICFSVDLLLAFPAFPLATGVVVGHDVVLFLHEKIAELYRS